MKRKLLFIVVLMALSIGVYAKKYKVAVAMPKAQQTQFERTADWALQTIANDPEIVAMIGPKTSVHAKVAATAFNAKEKTLLPVATSTELQRIYSAKPNVFFLSESDMTLSYLMIGGILLHGMNHVSLITSDDVNRHPDVKMRDLYQGVARLTTGSHASVYNEAHYGNLFHNTIAEFLPDQVPSGIKEVVNSKSDSSQWYDLQGRRIAPPIKSGLYIKDNKKVILK
ncbi:MAG: hypothetical protein IJ580_03110 [Prevotella sp.]|nr:hypothetical protein [Prevotella sp.]